MSGIELEIPSSARILYFSIINAVFIDSSAWFGPAKIALCTSKGQVVASLEKTDILTYHVWPREGYVILLEQ